MPGLSREADADQAGYKSREADSVLPAMQN